MIESATASGTPEASRKAPGDLAGLVTTAGASGTVAAALAASLADYLALIDEMRTASIPTELPTMTVSIDGSHRKPELIGATTDIADGAWNSAGDSIVLRIPAAATIQTARWIVSKLSDSASAATDIGAALAASGWKPDLIVASRSGVRARGPESFRRAIRRSSTDPQARTSTSPPVRGSCASSTRRSRSSRPGRASRAMRSRSSARASSLRERAPSTRLRGRRLARDGRAHDRGAAPRRRGARLASLTKRGATASATASWCVNLAEHEGW